MAQSRHPDRVGECPLSGAKRTHHLITPRLLLTQSRHWTLFSIVAHVAWLPHEEVLFTGPALASGLFREAVPKFQCGQMKKAGLADWWTP
jgi:hypothetical protein